MRMAALGHQVQILTTDPSGALPTDEICQGLAIRRVKAWPKHRDYYFSPQIYSEIARAEYDIVHFQGYNTFVAPIGMMAAIRFSVPFVLTFHSGGHSSRFRNAIRGTQQKMLSPLVCRAAHLIGVSQYEAEFFRARMGLSADKVSVVPNGAELPPPSNPPPERQPHLILSVGRLERYKGHHRAIEALRVLRVTIPDARLVIVGSGPYEGGLRRIASDNGVADHVTFLSVPSSERQQLTDLLYQAGLVVLLSQYEAHPVAVMEALSVGRPVLVSHTTGLKELAQKGLCSSVPLDADQGQLVAAMSAELTRDKPPTPVALPDWDACASELLQIYKRVVH